MVVRSAVNRLVAGSNPALPAKSQNQAPLQLHEMIMQVNKNVDYVSFFVYYSSMLNGMEEW